MNAYVSVDELKRRGNMDIKGSDSDRDLLRNIRSMSRRAESFCGRYFFSLEQAKKFAADGSHILLLPDLISIDASGLKTDDDRDRTFETTWATTDYLLFPDNADPATRLNPESGPYWRIEADLSAGTKGAFPAGAQVVQIEGEWGYWKHTRVSGVTVNGAHSDATVTVISITGDNAVIEQGHTILIGSEQMFVESYEDGKINVIRGVNGSTAAAQTGGEAISIFEYPDDVVEAVIVMVRRHHANALANFANVQGFPDGSIQTFGGMSRDAADLLQPFKVYTI